MCIFVNIFAVMLTLPLAAAESFTDVQLLFKNLTTDRNRHMRPQKYFEDTTYVAMAFTLLHLDGIDAVSGTVTIAGYFTVTWKDENLVWLPSDYNDTQIITLSHDQIWKPPLINANSIKEVEMFGQDGTYVELHYNGTAVWYPRERLPFICDIDTTYFPFDKQICPLSVVSWGFPIGKIALRSLANTVNTNYYRQNSEWDLTETSVSIRNIGVPEVQFNFHFKRRSQFLVSTLIFPGCFIAFLNVCVFFLPQDSGERIGFSITLLLAVVVFFTIAQDLLPSTSVPRLSSFCIILMADLMLSGMIVVSNIISARIYYKSEGDPIPNWVQNIVHFGLFYCLLAPSNHVHDRHSAIRENEMEKDSYLQNTYKEELYDKVTWKRVANYWDKFSFVAYILSFIIVCMFFFIDVAIET